MTNKERVLAAIRFEQGAGVPHHIYFTQQSHEAMLAYTGDPGYAARFNDHISTAFLNQPQQPLQPLHDRDEFSVVWNKSGVDREIGVIENTQVSTWEELQAYAFPPVNEAYIRSVMQQLQQAPATQFNTELNRKRLDEPAFLRLCFASFARRRLRLRLVPSA